MAFRSNHRFLLSGFSLTACTLLVPFALSCSSDDGNGAQTPTPPFNQGNLPNQPSPTDVSQTPERGGSDTPAQPTGTGANPSEGQPVNAPIADGQTTPPAGGPTTEAPPTAEAPPTQIPIVGVDTPENTGSACNVSAAQLRQNTNLPDPFAMHDGTRITTKDQWECRRNEIKKDIEQFEIGAKPEPPTVAATLNGNMLSVNVSTAAGSITLTSNVTRVNGATGPSCVAIGMGTNSSLINGCVQVPFNNNQVVNLNYNGTINNNDPFYTVYPELRGRIANYSAWSWGISRLIDGIAQVKDQLNVNMTKIGVHGCSASGKMALFGGAFDERVALTLVQESGGGGVNSWRLSQAFTDRTGVQIEKIDNTNYSWFLQSMQRQNPNMLPHDHHELIAMIAPRAVAIFGNRDYEWLGDESGYKSTKAAQEVWKALGADANFGYDFTTGHVHCTAAPSQVNTANAFVNKFLKDQAADTNIAIPPPVNGSATFDLDQTKAINWQTPALL